MSYDIIIGQEDLNYTSNLADLFHDHINRYNEETGEHITGLQALRGLQGAEAGPLLKQALSNIRLLSQKELEKYEPPNRWGGVTGAVIFLARIMGACYENPTQKVEVDA